MRIFSVPFSMKVDPAFIDRFLTTKDWDGDGYEKTIIYGGEDCRDSDPAINPSADDPLGDGIDSNCDGVDGYLTIYMFSSSTVYSGNMGGRAVIDSICASDISNYPDLPIANVMGFISVNGDDAIMNMPIFYGVPTDHRIVGPTEKKIADNWADLLDGTIDMTLQQAEIVDDYWWSGSLSDGDDTWCCWGTSSCWTTTSGNGTGDFS